MLKAGAEDSTPKTMREMIQKKFLEEIIGCSSNDFSFYVDDRVFVGSNVNFISCI